MKLRTPRVHSRYFLLVGATIFLVSITIFLSDPAQDAITGATDQISLTGVQPLSGTLTSWITGVIGSMSYLGVFGLMLLEGTSLPIPSEIVLPFAGYLVSTGRLDFWFTVAVATTAGVLGALIDYFIGMFLGMRTVYNYGSRFFVSQEQMKKVESLFERRGAAIVFASRLIPGVRTLASFPAGSARMSLAKFTVYTTLGCFGFNTLLVYAGDYLGSHWSEIRGISTVELVATVVVLVACVLVFLRVQRRAPPRSVSEPSN